MQSSLICQIPRYFLAACLFTCALAYASDDRNFSGSWKLNVQQSEVHGSADKQLRIDQQGPAIRMFRVAAADGKPALTLDTAGMPTRDRDGGTSMNSQTKWEGAALLIQTLVSTPTESYTIADHWRLSRDGNHLTIHRQITRPGGEQESTLVYDRVGSTPPTVVMAENGSAPRIPDYRPPEPVEKPTGPAATLVERPPTPPAPVEPTQYLVATGTKIPLRLINSVNTRHSAIGDKVYLETVYPILSKGKIIIPTGSNVIGSLTEVKRAGHVKGKSEIFVRFDSLTLPNGTTRDFKARVSNMDDNGKGSLDRSEGKIEGEGRRGPTARTVGQTAAAGAGIGAIAGGAAGHLGMGAGIGAAAGALGGLLGSMAAHGPDAVLERGSTLEMVLDRDLAFTPEEIAR